MDTGNYMANQMSDIIENSQNIQDEFNDWLDEAIEEFCKGKRIEPHDVFPHVNLSDAKLAFLDGMLAQEYLKATWS